MALKPDRYLLDTEVSYFMNETAEKGVVVVHALAAGIASGAAMDVVTNSVIKPVAQPLAVSSGVPVGILLSDVVNKDLTRTHLNQHKDEVQQGGKVAIVTRGWVVTDQVIGAVKAGDPAFVTSSGILTATFANTNDNRVARVGTFRTSRDANDFVKVEIQLA